MDCKNPVVMYFCLKTPKVKFYSFIGPRHEKSQEVLSKEGLFIIINLRHK